MRLLFTSDLSGLGGGEVGLIYLVQELSKQHVCEVICGTPGSLVSRLEDIGVTASVIPYKDKSRLLQGHTALKKEIARFKPDCILNNDPTTACLVHAAAGRVPNYWICHGQWYQFSPVKKKLILRSIRGALCVSDAARFNLENQGFEHCATVNLGVPSSKFANVECANLREQLNIPPDDLIVATIARFQPIKGQIKGVKAIEAALKEGLRVTYLLVGGSVFASKEDDAYEAMVRQYVHDAGLEEKMLFLGERGDVPSILNDVDVLMIPSDNESFGLVAIEAIASGTPIISTPNDGVTEILENNSAFIAPSNDSEGLKGLLIDYASPGYKDKAVIQLKRFQEKYDIKLVAQRYLDAIETREA